VALFICLSLTRDSALLVSTSLFLAVLVNKRINVPTYTYIYGWMDVCMNVYVCM
jgi:hypothetical protein